MIDGFLGYQLTKSPIGKRSNNDEANYWTIVIDAKNFAGPVMYMSAWFWDSRINWHPESISWSDPRSLIGYIAEGFEGSVGAAKKIIGGAAWRRVNKWRFPKDKNERTGFSGESTTLFTGHQQYGNDWAKAALDPILDGTVTSETSALKDASSNAATTPDCNLPDRNERMMKMGIFEGEEGDDDSEVIFQDFGVGESVEGLSQTEAKANGCPMRLSLDPSKMDCKTDSKWCSGKRYLKRIGTNAPMTLKDEEVPVTVKTELDTIEFQPSRLNDGRYYGPPQEEEKFCFDSPGPATEDPQLYCSRTKDATWIAWRWYRFIDQPEMNQVFASIPPGERDAARCYMQQRIENLHRFQASSGDGIGSRWFQPPQGLDKLPTDLASIDESLLMTPPAGMEFGYVPIPVYQRKRTKPADCDVTVGEIVEEPNPLPPGYYEGYAWEQNSRDPEMCPANNESDGIFRYVGKVYQYPWNADNTRVGYQPPLYSELADYLSDPRAVCTPSPPTAAPPTAAPPTPAPPTPAPPTPAPPTPTPTPPPPPPPPPTPASPTPAPPTPAPPTPAPPTPAPPTPAPPTAAPPTPAPPTPAPPTPAPPTPAPPTPAPPTAAPTPSVTPETKPRPGKLHHVGYAGDPVLPKVAGHSKCPYNIQGWDGNLATQMGTNGGSQRPALLNPDGTEWMPGDPPFVEQE